MFLRSPVHARREGRGGTGQRTVLLRRLLLLMVVSRKGRVGMIRHRLLLVLLVLVVLMLRLLVVVVVLLVEMGLHVVVLGRLPMVSVMVLLSVLARDAAAGSLWVVEEGGHHGGGTTEVAEKPGCVCYVGVGEWLAALMHVLA